MSTQHANGSEFSIATDQQPFRLLELPPELLELLSSPNPPKLYFKSPDSRDVTRTAEAVLCTPAKTYFMRQQQTSNGVHIIAPASTSTACGADDISEPGLTAISQCTSSLELMAAPVESAKSALRDILPVFIDSEDAERTLPEYHDKESLFAHTPMSEAECQNTWTDLVAFELIPSRNLPRRCFRPSANVLLRTWTRLMEIALSEGINLAGTLRTGTMLEALWNPDEEWPYELRAAIMNRLISNRSILSDQEHAESALRDGSTLDRVVTVRWLGQLILQAHHESQPASPRMPKDVFVETWKDNLPEEWREDAKIDALPKGLYAVAGDHIRFESEGVEQATADTASASLNKNSTKAAGGNKRKWHEKFAAARKQGKPS